MVLSDRLFISNRIHRKLKRVALLFSLAAGMTACVVNAADPENGIEYFERHVRPLLVERCYPCHSSQAEKGIKGGLNLESKSGWTHGGDSGPAVIPGDPDRSLLIKAVRYNDPDLQMPPKGKALDAELVGHLEAWVRMGAPDPRDGSSSAPGSKLAHEGHWAFQRVVEPVSPGVRNRSQVQNPIDAFLLARLEPAGLKLSKPADRHTLLRRIHFVLTGLPPSPEEVDSFIADHAPDAYSRRVDQLLASPHYGERWGRYWLDVARYADTKGYVFEEERRYPYSYTYRDYVIRAFNEDLPYDRFILEQIAADLLPLGSDRRPLAAMGFLTLGRRFLNNQSDIIDDRIDVVTRGMMGLTVVCARCHDHKFDPIPTQDYYSLYGVFASSHEPDDKPSLGDASFPKEYPEYLAERKKRVEERVHYRASQDAEALLRVRGQMGDYLLAANDASMMKDAEASEKLVRERKLEPAVAQKFRVPYSRWLTNPPPALALWIRLASIPASNFVSQAPVVVEELHSHGNSEWSSYVAAHPSLESLKEVALVYNDWFKAAAQGMVPTGPATNAPSLAQARDFLTSDDSPMQLNADELHRVFPTPVQQKLRALQRNLDELDATHVGAPPRAMAMAENAQPHDPHVFKRGNPGLPGDAVPRQFLQILSGKERKPFQKGSGRLEMAQAVASRDNPLTARVFVNRVWAYHLGSPLVKTPSDFGVRSDPPSHPALLDYLASRFMAEGWSVKNLHRMIVMSAAFQQSSEDQALGNQVDPGNQLFWRQNRRRLDFESMRDTLLAVSGTLDRTAGGHAVDITSDSAPNRRTVYGFVERQNLPGLFRTFDFASPDSTSPQRFSTTVPQQALFLMNSPFIVQQARAILKRPEVLTAQKNEDKVRRLYELTFQRDPDAQDLTMANDFLRAKIKAKDDVIPEVVWEYGVGTVDAKEGRVSRFTPLPHFSNYAWQGGKELPDPKIGWVLLSATGGHPGKNSDFAAVRRWIAPQDGSIIIRAELSHASDKGDGVRGRVISSRMGVVGDWVAQHSKTNTVVQKLKVKKSDTVDFVTDCRTDEGFDSFDWAPRIRYIAASEGDPPPEGPKLRWVAKDDFSGPKPPLPASASPWELYAQALLLSNELFFVD